MIKSFGIENFRVFRDRSIFDFAPITILTGSNNSGKSSLIKALCLLNGNNKKQSGSPLEMLNFHGQLGSFRISKNSFSDKDTMTFSLSIQPYIMNESWKPEPGTFGVESNNITGEARKYYYQAEKATIELTYRQFDERGFLDKMALTIYDGENSVGEKKLFEFERVSKTFISFYINFDFILSNLRVKDDFISFLKKYNEFIPDEKLDDFFSNLHGILKATPTKYFDKQECAKLLGLDSVLRILSSFVAENALVLINSELMHSKTSAQHLIRYVFDFIKKALDHIRSFNILRYSPVNGNPGRIYLQEDDPHQGQGFFNRAFETMSKKVNMENSIYRNIISGFIEKWLKEFEIGDGFRIKRLEGIGSQIEIIKNNRVESIADTGNGTHQLISMFITIINSAQLYSDTILGGEGNIKSWNYEKDVLVVEEPEANLHPSLQTKLADFFVELQKNFYKTIIIETHSEYLVRRLQFLAASQKINHRDVLMYYLNSPVKAEQGEKQVRKIFINEAGKLSEDFGTGFLDESEKLRRGLKEIGKLN